MRPHSNKLEISCVNSQGNNHTGFLKNGFQLLFNKSVKYSTLVLLTVIPAHANIDLTQLSLEQLLSVEITSVAKKKQQLSDAAAAIHVITRDDIRRSGATSLPELLRLVPGVQVSRIDGSRYAVSIRGFSGRHNGKLLVLQDGRTLYSSLFSGVYWEAQDVLLEDVDRIEVIRGPGSTLWGANAVNGVINIITRDSKQTQGVHVDTRTGNLENGIAVRSGGSEHFRLYAKFDNHAPLETDTGEEAHDSWKQNRTGFRSDFSIGSQDHITLQGDYYDKEAEHTTGFSPAPAGPPPFVNTSFIPDTAQLSGGNVLFNWQRTVSEDEEWKLQAYYDHARIIDAVVDQRVNTSDIELQHRFRLTNNQDLTWGLGYRKVSDELNGTYTLSFTPEKKDTHVYSVFVQDEILLGNKFNLTLGTKIDHNDYTDYEYQPSIRLHWQTSDTSDVWGAVSRAVQTPSRATRDSKLNFAVTDFFVLSNEGNSNLQSEELIAWEAGYRGQFSSRFNLDAAIFYNKYDKLLSREFNGSTVGVYDNLLEGKTYGGELASNWQVTPDWRLRASYSYLAIDIKTKAGGTDTASAERIEGAAPQDMVKLQSQFSLSQKMELDAALYYVSELSSLSVDAYTRLDLGLGWQPTSYLHLSLTAQNLLDERHREYRAQDITASEVPRSVYASAKLRM